MALSKLLLLQALLFSLLLLIVPSHCRVVPAYTRPAIRQATNTICGITAGLLHRRIQCTKLPESSDLSAVVPSLPSIRPSICVQDLCGASGVVCKKSEKGATNPRQFSSEFLEQLRALSNTVWQTVLHKRWLIYAILGILFFIFCVGGFLSCRVYCCGVIENDLPVPTFPDMENVLVISFNEIQLITNNFRERIGSGSFGTVFLGQLSTRQVAVKRRKTRLESALERSFRAEVETLSKAHHENIADLIGYCTENNERILVYEFISGKDLYGHLHPRFWQKTSPPFSSWELRVRILRDVAKGIEYLHKNAEPRIVQRDIKSKNILIDENWVAKISDFGTAVFGPEQGTDYVPVVAISGTEGYMSWECRYYLRAAPSNDVYSFGVVMLEVVTGRKPIADLASVMREVVTCRKANRVLAYFAPPLIQSGKLMDILDKRLAVPVGPALEAVTRVAQLATECVDVPAERPDISVILTRLEDALALFHDP